jgi:superoxide reductase
MSKQKFFKCNLCGNLVGIITDNGAPLVCCGSKMAELIPNIVDAAEEKHLPQVSASGDSVEVQVGSVLHPMSAEHHIAFVYVETEQGGQRKKFKIDGEPKTSFLFADDKPVAYYAYCNLHGLWKVEA